MIGAYRLTKPYCALIVSKPRKLLASCMLSLMHNQFLGLLELLFPLIKAQILKLGLWIKELVKWGILFICYGWRFLQISTTMETLLSLIEIKLLFLYYNHTLSFRNMSWSFSHDFLRLMWQRGKSHVVR